MIIHIYIICVCVSMCVCVYSGYVCMLWTDVICLYSFSSLNKLLGATVSLVLTALWAAMMNEMGPAAQGAPSPRAVTGGGQKQSLRHVATGRWESGHEAMSSVGPLTFTREGSLIEENFHHLWGLP